MENPFYSLAAFTSWTQQWVSSRYAGNTKHTVHIRKSCHLTWNILQHEQSSQPHVCCKDHIKQAAWAATNINFSTETNSAPIRQEKAIFKAWDSDTAVQLQDQDWNRKWRSKLPVTPLVVIPRNKLNKAIIQSNSSLCIKNTWPEQSNNRQTIRLGEFYHQRHQLTSRWDKK
jgi:hypothetical protein